MTRFECPKFGKSIKAPEAQSRTMDFKNVLLTILLLLFCCSDLSAQTKKKLKWMRNHPKHPTTRRWIKNHPEHPMTLKIKARRTNSTTESDDDVQAEKAKPVSKKKSPEMGLRREWVDVTGSFKVKAAFVSQTETEVTLKLAETGELRTLLIAKLSEKDQKYLDTWMKTSLETKIRMITQDIERRCKREISTKEREMVRYNKKIDRYHTGDDKGKYFRDDALILKELKRRRDRASTSKAQRRLDTAVITRWEKGEPTQKDLSSGYFIVYSLLCDEASACDRRIEELKNEYKWAARRTVHLIRGGDSPYQETAGGFYTNKELAEAKVAAAEAKIAAAKAKAAAADFAALKKKLTTPRSAGTLYVQRLLGTATIQRAVFISETPVNLSPKALVPGNQLDPTRYRRLTYQVDYVSNAGIQMQRFGTVIVQRHAEGYWAPKEHNGFSFITTTPAWPPSNEAIGEAMGRAFSNPGKPVPIRDK